MTSIRKYVGWVIGIALFAWGTIGAFSIFEKLKFLVDGWAYSCRLRSLIFGRGVPRVESVHVREFDDDAAHADYACLS
jgi:hypothetical protein